MPAMDLQAAIDGVERFLARWRNGNGPADRGRMHDLGSVIIQAGLDRDAPELTTTHLETLLNALSTLRDRPIPNGYTAAGRHRALLDNPITGRADDNSRIWLLAGQLRQVLDDHDALLADRARMAAELEQVRGECDQAQTLLVAAIGSGRVPSAALAAALEADPTRRKTRTSAETTTTRPADGTAGTP